APGRIGSSARATPTAALAFRRGERDARTHRTIRHEYTGWVRARRVARRDGGCRRPAAIRERHAAHGVAASDFALGGAALGHAVAGPRHAPQPRNRRLTLGPSGMDTRRCP